MAANKSKISDALLSTIENCNEKAAKMQPVHVDPFEQANQQSIPTLEQNTGNEKETDANRIQLEGEDAIDDIFTEVARENSRKARKRRPRTSNFKAPIKKGGGVISGIALALSIIAMGGSGYHMYSQGEAGQIIKNAIDQAEEKAGAFASVFQKFTDDFKLTKNEVQNNTNRVVILEQLAKKMDSFELTISSIQEEVQAANGNIEKNQRLLSTFESQLSDFSKVLNSRQKQKVSKRVVRKKVQEIVKEDTNKIAGAKVTTIDQWGLESSVMLRDSHDGWIPLSTGDFYKGWRFIGVTEGEAYFTKGTKKRQLRAEG